MNSPARPLTAANRHNLAPFHEPATAQIASFIELFVMLLVLRGFFLPLFQIPTGSMAETLAGAYATHGCRNCGIEFDIGFHNSRSPLMIECPNCRWQEPNADLKRGGVRLNEKAGDRIVVHGWPYVFGGWLGPQRWDVVVFRNVNDPQQNYIKRLIGLPGETIEIIDGDIWVTPPGAAEPQIARKPRATQEALWFSAYNHDYPPKLPSKDLTGVNSRGAQARPPKWEYFKPRWENVAGDGWKNLEQRVVQFSGTGEGSIQFVTGPEGSKEPGEISDIYGYNGYQFGPLDFGENIRVESLERESHPVGDVRLSASISLAAPAGFVELTISKYADVIHARLFGDGRVTLEHENAKDRSARESWGEAKVNPVAGRSVRFAVGLADYQAQVEVEGRVLLTSTPAQFPVSAKIARERSALGTRPTIRITAGGGAATLAHLQVSRDVFYSSDIPPIANPKPQAAQGHPIKLRSDAYLVLGDNSTQSLDSRYWMPPPKDGKPVRPGDAVLAAHLQGRYARSDYDIGTIPADQMIGRAFLVYWPGFMPMFPQNTRTPDIVPDFGRIRWIR